MKRFLTVPCVIFSLWVFLLLGMVAGFRMRYAVPILLCGTIFAIGRRVRRVGFKWDDRAVGALYVGLILIFVGARILGKLLRFESGLSEYWDFGQYLQATYNLAEFGKPFTTFEGGELSYFGIHRSLSAYVLAAIYRWFEHPYVLWCWQTVWLIFPAFILRKGASFSTQHLSEQKRKVIVSLAPLLWLFSPVFSGQFYWSYHFHIAGISLLLLAGLFYEKNKWGPWMLCLIVASLEKEEFGLYAATFGVVAFLEKVRVRDFRFAAIGLGTAVFGVFGFFYFQKSDSQLNQVALYYSNWGASFWDVILGVLRDPMKALELWSRSRPMKLILFPILVSGFWIAPTWIAARYLLIVLPIVLVYGLGEYAPLTNIRNHYALPILGFSCLGLLFGTVPSLRPHRSTAFFRFSVGLLAVACFGFHSPFRKIPDWFEAYRSRGEELDKVAWIKKDKNLVVCCDMSLCSHFSERAVVIEARLCSGRKSVLEPYLGREVVWILPPKAGRDHAVQSDQAFTQYSFFQVSSPAVIN